MTRFHKEKVAADAGAGFLQDMSARMDIIKTFPDVDAGSVNGKKILSVDTDSFLQAFERNMSKVYPVMFGGEGMLSKQLSGDLDNNLDKIRRHFLAHPAAYSTLDAIAREEVAQHGIVKLLKEKDVAVKGMLWLARTLNFLCTLLEKLAALAGEESIDRKKRTPAKVAQETYAETLEPFHGWVARTAFSSALSFFADTPKLLSLFGFETELQFKAAALDFTAKLRPYIDNLFLILDKYDVHFTYKVM